jgi:transcriptional regulator with XRE-family HTH domain
MDHGITLRDFARRLEVSPTYISQIEQGNFKPPAEPVVVSMARILGQDSDELLALAGRVADDLDDIIRGQPKELATFLRKAKGLTPEDIARFSQQAERIHQERATRHHETCSPKRNGVCLRSASGFSLDDCSTCTWRMASR